MNRPAIGSPDGFRGAGWKHAGFWDSSGRGSYLGLEMSAAVLLADAFNARFNETVAGLSVAAPAVEAPHAVVGLEECAICAGAWQRACLAQVIRPTDGLLEAVARLRRFTGVPLGLSMSGDMLPTVIVNSVDHQMGRPK